MLARCTRNAPDLLYEDLLGFAAVYDAMGTEIQPTSEQSSPRLKRGGRVGMLVHCGDPASQLDLIDALFQAVRKRALPAGPRRCLAKAVGCCGCGWDV